MEKDLYEILGVSKTATGAEIRKAFHKLAKKYHPDVNPGNKAAEQHFKEANLAHEVLKDAKKRAHYDQMRAAGANPFGRGAPHQGAGRWQSQTGDFSEGGLGDFGLGDLFEEIFGGGMRGGRRGRATPPHNTQWSEGPSFKRRGGDLETSLTISFQEAARGGERYIELTDGRKLTISIPEGVATGSKIKLKGQGEPGSGGGPAGDLILALTVLQHPHFEREGQDILFRMPITFSEAVFGAEVDVPTLDGKVVMKIPPGVSSLQRLKLSGKGIRLTKDGKRGDEFVEVYIKVPKPLDAEHKEAAKLAESSSFNPRRDL